MAFEELKGEGSDTVFHAQNAVNKSLQDQIIYTDSWSASIGPRYYNACEAEAGTVRASQRVRRDHAEHMHGHLFLALDACFESKHQERHPRHLLVARLEGQSAWARVYRIEHNEAQNRIHARNSKSKYSAVKSILTYWHHFYLQHAYVLCCNGFSSIGFYRTRRSAALPYAENDAGTHAEPLFYTIYGV